MTHTPSTFAPLADGWTLTAVNIEAAPESLREALAAGIPATVPGEATLDLLNAGLIADPFDGANENDQQWIGDVDWRFTCRFDWHDNGADRHDLVAYGLDTIADVALNGRPVASTRNFHRSYRWDVRDLLREGSNELTVTFTSPVRESDRMEQARAWEIARMWKTMPYENRTIMSNLAKRPLKKLLVEDLKLHTVSEQYGSLLRIAAGDLGDEHSAQQDEKYISRVNDWRYATRDMEEPQTAESWRTMPLKAAEWWKKVEAGEIENPYVFEHSNEPEDYEF